MEENLTEKNMSRTDARIRTFVAAPALTVIGACVLRKRVGGSPVVSVAIAGTLFAMAGANVVFSRTQNCPVYTALGISTYSQDEAVADAMSGVSDVVGQG